jgi:WD40 repeat protein
MSIGAGGGSRTLGHSVSVTSVVFGKGAALFTASEDGTVLRWDISSGEVVRCGATSLCGAASEFAVAIGVRVFEYEVLHRDHVEIVSSLWLQPYRLPLCAGNCNDPEWGW